MNESALRTTAEPLEELDSVVVRLNDEPWKSMCLW